MSDDDEEEDRLDDQLNEEADIAADFLEELLDIADYEGDIEMGIRNGRPVVQIVADDDSGIKHLIGRDGEVVTALQQLTRLAVQQKTGERSRLILDVDGYLTKRRKKIREEVLDAIDEVRETGEPVSLDPMNSFERKIVHDIVRDEGLKSRSHDTEPNRYVTIYLKKSGDSEDEDDEDEYDEDEEAAPAPSAASAVAAVAAASARRSSAAPRPADPDDEVNDADADVEDALDDEDDVDVDDAEDVEADEEHDDEVTDDDIADEEAGDDDADDDEDVEGR